MGLILPFRANRLAFPGGSPGINYAHPAARNLRGSVYPVLAPGLGSAFNILTSKKGGGAGTINSCITDPFFGVAATQAVSTVGLTFAAPALPGTTPTGFAFTMACFIRCRDLAGNNNPISLSGTAADGIYLHAVTSGFAPRFAGITDLNSGVIPIANIPYFYAVSAIYRGGTSWDSYHVVKRLDTGAVRSAIVNTATGAVTISDPSVFYYGCSDGSGSTANQVFGPAMCSTAALTMGELLRWADDPWSFWYPQRIDLVELLQPPPPSGPTGTLAVTEPTDTAAFAGTVAITGTLATTEAADVAAFTGAGAVSGTLATTEATDVAAFTGTVAITGTLATTEAADVAAFAGNVGSVGILAATEAADVTAFAGTFSGVVSGTLAATELTDAAAFAGSAAGLPTGSLAALELPDNVIVLADYRAALQPVSPSPYPSPLDYGWYNSEPDVWIDRGRPGGGTQD